MSDCSVQIKLKNGDVIGYTSINEIPVSKFKESYKEDLIELENSLKSKPSGCNSNRYLGSAISSAEYSPEKQAEIDAQKAKDDEKKEEEKKEDEVRKEEVSPPPNDSFVNNENITNDVGETPSSNIEEKNKTKSEVGKNADEKDSSLVKEHKPPQPTQPTQNNTDEATLGKSIGGIGGSAPMVSINGYIFSSRELISLEIESVRFIPTVALTIKLETGVFISKHFPKDGDLVSIFIRSFSDVFKPIRHDYFITNVFTSTSKDNEGSDIYIYIDGILNINYLFAEVCASNKDMTSFEALLDISKKLKLGFASNETNTNDKMTWICPYETYLKYIDNITIHAYKDSESFFDSWIDFYYTLNFNNMNLAYSVSDSLESLEGLMGSVLQNDYNRDDNINNHQTKHIFTNAPGMEHTNYFYRSLEFVNNSGEINILNGYKRFIHFYDVNLRERHKKDEKNHESIFVDPFSTESVNSYKNMMRGRPREDYYKNTDKHKWQGIQYSVANVHDNWKLSEFINFQNLEFVDKMLVKIRLPKPNFNLYRGQRVPLACIITKDVERGKVAGSVGKDDFRAIGFTADRFLTANNYVIVGIKIIYTQGDYKNPMNGSFEQELVLGRREWEFPTKEYTNKLGEDYIPNTL